MMQQQQQQQQRQLQLQEQQRQQQRSTTGAEEAAHRRAVRPAFGLRGGEGARADDERSVLGGQVLALPDRAERHALFDRIDNNGNGALSLAEIDKAVVELWPQFDHKRALMRAYKAADSNGDGFIKRHEFGIIII